MSALVISGFAITKCNYSLSALPPSLPACLPALPSPPVVEPAQRRHRLQLVDGAHVEVQRAARQAAGGGPGQRQRAPAQAGGGLEKQLVARVGAWGWCVCVCVCICVLKSTRKTLRKV